MERLKSITCRIVYQISGHNFCKAENIERWQKLITDVLFLMTKHLIENKYCLKPYILGLCEIITTTVLAGRNYSCQFVSRFLVRLFPGFVRVGFEQFTHSQISQIIIQKSELKKQKQKQYCYNIFRNTIDTHQLFHI